MDKLIEYLPFIIPIVIVELALMVIALVHILKHKKYRFGNRTFWLIVVIIPNLLFPILYLTLGKEEE